MSLPALAEHGDFTLQPGVFGHTSFHVTGDEALEHGFAVGGVDFFLNADMGDRVHLLVETVLELVDGEPVFDLERVYIEGDPAQIIHARMGRFHTPIGHYSTAFHHPLLFQLTTRRPALVEFEDLGGLLPAHLVGAEVDLRTSLGQALDYELALAVGNGRAQGLSATSQLNDPGATTAAYVARLSVRPKALEHLNVGASYYADTLTADDLDVNEQIVGGHAVWVGPLLHFAAEGYLVRHAPRSGANTQMTGAFAELGVHIETITPYIEGEWMERDADDAYYSASGAPEALRSGGVGVNYMPHAKIAIKTQYNYDLHSEQHMAELQFAFGM